MMNFINPHQVKLMRNIVSDGFIKTFHDRHEINLVSGCWTWTGAKSLSRRKGENVYYGYMSFGGTLQPAHRASWKIHFGEIPNGLVVCHKCDNTICCNPDHLFLGTDKDNVQDKIKKGRHNLPKGSSHWKTKKKAAMLNV